MNYEDAKECYATWGIDTDQAIKQLSDISISVHCWQGDDVVGFENKSGLSGGGILILNALLLNIFLTVN